MAAAAHVVPSPALIGTLNEGALHAGLKAWYARAGDRVEERVGGYVVDIVRGDLAIEIQTAGFAPLRRKLPELLREHRVRVVTPIALERRIVRLSDDAEALSARRSPRHGRVEDVFARLVSIPALLAEPGFEIEILLTRDDELRVLRPGRAFRRHGWVVVGRALREVVGSVLLRSPADARALLPADLPASFDCGELAAALGVDRRLAQQMTYCLRAVGVLEPAGKRGQALLHVRV